MESLEKEYKYIDMLINEHHSFEKKMDQEHQFIKSKIYYAYKNILIAPRPKKSRTKKNTCYIFAPFYVFLLSKK